MSLDKTDNGSLSTHEDESSAIDLPIDEFNELDQMREQYSDTFDQSDDGSLTSKPSKILRTHASEASNTNNLATPHRLGGDLRELPRRLSDAINTGDIAQVKTLIDDNFDVNCTVKTPAIAREYSGREYVFTLFESLLQSFPDFVFVCKKVRTTSYTVACRINFTGTKAITAPNEHLFKPRECNLVNEIMKTKKLKADEESVMRKLESMLHSQGKLILLWGGGYLILHYDAQTLKITRFEMNMKITSFKESTITV
jgi:hypothetical protein